ncbi:MAG: class I SAM-dependent methyltransferase [Candidatus Moranbacteria bacterium]|nr:class I SAM-dependent methyltransferase [Candidatus Moranbacteria bacterium]
MSIDVFYDDLAPVYEERIITPQVNAQLLPKIKDIFKKNLITRGTILDIGCGPGNLKTFLGDSFSYTGMDISQEMLKQARLKEYTVVCGLIQDNLPKIPDKSFDYCVSVSALHFVENIQEIISHLDRVSRKGWVVTLADVSDVYKQYFSVHAAVYNHTNIAIDNLKEDITIDGWISPKTKEMIRERIVFK